MTDRHEGRSMLNPKHQSSARDEPKLTDAATLYL